MMGNGSLRGSRLGRGAMVVAAAAVLVLLASSCSKSSNTTSGGSPSYSVFVQKFRFHGLPTTVPSGNLTVDFSNRESLPITHEMVLVSLPQGKSKQDIISDANKKGAKSEDDWLHFGEIPEVDSGATKAQVFDLPAGTYALACWQNGNLGGGTGKVHAARGMVFQFTVS